MNTLTIFYGALKPLKAIGKHQSNLLHFAHKYKGWHSIDTKNRDAMRAMKALERKGYLLVIQDQFKLEVTT
jgi:hypothetical protein